MLNPTPTKSPRLGHSIRLHFNLYIDVHTLTILFSSKTSKRRESCDRLIYVCGGGRGGEGGETTQYVLSVQTDQLHVHVQTIPITSIVHM